MPFTNSLMSTTHEVTSLGQPDLSWPKGHLKCFLEEEGKEEEENKG